MKSIRNIFLALFICLLWIPMNTSALELEEIQKAIEEAGADWVAGETNVSVLSEGEQQMLLGLNFPAYMEDDMWTPRFPKGKDASYHDWRDHQGANWLTPIRDQGQCGACSSFATVGAMEAAIKINQGNPFIMPDLSEQHLFSCSVGICQWGQMPFQSLMYLQNNGAPDEACYEYRSGDNGTSLPCESSCEDWRNRVWRISDYYHVAANVEAIKAAIAIGPVHAGFLVYEDFMSYKSGVYKHVTGSYSGGHAIVLVGYDDANQCWIARNSWNTLWGEDGYFRIAYGDSGINLEVYAIDFRMEDNASLAVAPIIGGPYYDEQGSDQPRRFDLDQKIKFYLEYEDFNCDLSGGEAYISVDGGEFTRVESALGDELFCDNTESGDLLKVSFSVEVAEGVHSFQAYLKDLHGMASNTVEGQFQVLSSDDDDDDDASGDDDDDASGDDDDDDDSGGCA